MSGQTPGNQGSSTSSTARGLGYAHRKIRARLIANHADGTPCPCLAEDMCGRGCPCRRAGRGLPMYRDANLNVDGMALEADHSIARSLGGTKADRLLLATCNRSRGDGTRVGRGDDDPAGSGQGTDGRWDVHPTLGKPAPPWWTRDWMG